MATFFETMTRWLRHNGYAPAFTEYVPDDPDELVAALVYHTGPPAPDGTITRRVQIQVRRKDPLEAYKVAQEIAEKLDSGPDEDLIYLGPGYPTISRITQAPRAFGRDKRDRATYYIEAAIWTNAPE